jgi:hypothetical protein
LLTRGKVRYIANGNSGVFCFLFRSYEILGKECAGQWPQTFGEIL